MKQENTVRQSLLWINARKTKIFHSSQIEDKTIKEKCSIRTNKPQPVLDKEIFKIACKNSIWSKYFEHNNIRPIKIHYEDLVENKKQVMDVLSQSLMISGMLFDVQPKLKKLSSSSTSELYDKHFLRLLSEVSVTL